MLLATLRGKPSRGCANLLITVQIRSSFFRDAVFQARLESLWESHDARNEEKIPICLHLHVFSVREAASLQCHYPFGNKIDKMRPNVSKCVPKTLSNSIL
jgi:hypothetical protein